MQASDVNVVHLESNEQPGRSKGDVDGAVTFDPYRAQFLKAGAATLFDSTQIPGEIVDPLAVRVGHRQGAEGDPGAAHRLVRRDRLHQARACRCRAPYGHPPADERRQFQQAQQGLQVPTREENLRMLGGPQPELAVTGRRLMALMLDAKLLRSGLEIERVLEPGPLSSLP